MEHPLKSGIDGVLKRLQVCVGDQVADFMRSNKPLGRYRVWLRSKKAYQDADTRKPACPRTSS